MDPKTLMNKYNFLLRENQLLKERIISLEAALKNAGMIVVEESSVSLVGSNPEGISPAQKSSLDESDAKETPAFDKYSSPAEKIRLYLSLFKGRDDVYAHKFFNKKQGRNAYGPVKRKPWEMNAGDSPYAPFNARVVEDHLRNRNGLTAGIFPICLDDSCHFLAIDLDKGEWQADAKVLREICHRFEIPISIERSQSGNGAHIWFFFEKALPARKARQFGTALITAAMNIRHEITFSSYDRLFPNQDTLPKGGFGNLIALPLQKEARMYGNSEFVDEDFHSYADQWAYLAGIQKISVEDVGLFIEKLHAENGATALEENNGEDDAVKPWRKRQIVLAKADFPDKVKVTLANMVYIEKSGLSQRALSHLKRMAAFPNPEFYSAQAMRLSTYQYPRMISCSVESATHLGIPRGYREKVMALFESLAIPVTLTDETNPGEPLAVTFKGILRPEQEEAVSNMLTYETGILCGTTAFGKTVSALNIIAQRKVNTLILVNKTSLATQWQEKITEFLAFEEAENEEDAKKLVGQLGGGKKKLTNKIDVALLQSLYHKDNVHECLQNYGMIIVDECHHLSAFSFEKVLQAAPAKYVYGLTATPTRKDGHQPIVYMQCGPIRYKDNAKKQAKARPFDHRVMTQFTPFDPAIRQDMSLQTIYQHISENEERNQMLTADIISCQREGRNAIILTERVEHVKRLEDLLQAEIPSVIAITGGMGKKMIREKMQKIRSTPESEPLTIISTGKYIGEGFDEPRLDTLFLAMPVSWKGRLHQYAGRLHRLYEGKTEVRIYDYVDIHVSILERMYHKRLTGYAGIGYTVEVPNQDSMSRSLIYTRKDYFDDLKRDILSANKEVVIMSPSLTEKMVGKFFAEIKEALPEGVALTVVTKGADKIRNAGHRENRLQLIQALQKHKMNVQLQDSSQQRCVLIDQQIVWYGSIDVLGINTDESSFIRLESKKLAEDLHKYL